MTRIDHYICPQWADRHHLVIDWSKGQTLMNELVIKGDMILPY